MSDPVDILRFIEKQMRTVCNDPEKADELERERIEAGITDIRPAIPEDPTNGR